MAPRKQPWFRFYVEACSDAKLRRLPPAQRWLWVAVLAAAKQSDIQGHLMLTEREAMTSADLAEMAGMKVKEVVAGVDALLRLGLLAIDEKLGCWVVVAWARRQYESDDVTTRTRKHRSRNGPDPPDGTAMEPRWNVPSSAMERRWNGDGTDQIQIQKTDTPLESPRDCETAADESSAPVGAPKKRSTQLAKSWAPKDSHFALAAKHDVNDVDHQVEQFRNYHEAKGSTMKDWDAAFRTWLGNAPRFGSSKSVGDARDSDDPGERLAAYGVTRNREPRAGWMDHG